MSGAGPHGTILVQARPKVLENSRTRTNYCRSFYAALVLRHTYKVSKRIFFGMTSVFSNFFFAGSLAGS